MSDMSLCSGHHTLDGVQDTVEARFLVPELFPSRGGNGVVTRAPFGGRLSPLRRDPAFVLQSLERRIERALLDSQDPFGQPSNVLSDGIAVHRLQCERLQYEHVERAGEELRIGLRAWHGVYVDRLPVTCSLSTCDAIPG